MTNRENKIITFFVVLIVILVIAFYYVFSQSKTIQNQASNTVITQPNRPADILVNIKYPEKLGEEIVFNYDDYKGTESTVKSFITDKGYECVYIFDYNQLSPEHKARVNDINRTAERYIATQIKGSYRITKITYMGVDNFRTLEHLDPSPMDNYRIADLFVEIVNKYYHNSELMLNQGYLACEVIHESGQKIVFIGIFFNRDPNPENWFPVVVYQYPIN